MDPHILKFFHVSIIFKLEILDGKDYYIQLGFDSEQILWFKLLYQLTNEI